MRNRHGFTLIELLIVVAIIAILAAIAVPNFLEAQVRSKVSRVRSDHRSLATAIESYYVDNNQYPAGLWSGVATAPTGTASADSIVGVSGFSRTFLLRGTTQLSTLTTPIAYITNIFGDPFANTRALPFRYYRDSASRAGWILGSFGPNTDQGTGGDLQWATSGASAHVETVYTASISQPSILLVTGAPAGGAYTYDPTNGTVSSGDVWRVKD
jgi:prepilin-type N-terminal cleavage/methylation domain-containing protein